MVRNTAVIFVARVAGRRSIKQGASDFRQARGSKVSHARKKWVRVFSLARVLRLQDIAMFNNNHHVITVT